MAIASLLDSSDGRYAVFVSDAANLVAGDTNGQSDVFVKDLTGGATSLASVASSGVQADHGCSSATISDDGRYVTLKARPVTT